LTISFAHAMSSIIEVLGDMDSVAAELTTRHKKVRIVESGEERPMTSPDQVLLSGVMASGAPISVHYRGGRNAGTALLWEINGTAGNIQVTGPGGQLHAFGFTIKGARGAYEPLQPL